MNESSCFCLPKELLTPEFSMYSNKSKLLFAIVITEAETAKSINELSSLIQKIGEKRVSALYHQVHTGIAGDERRGLNNV